jgi:thioredoxin 2
MSTLASDRQGILARCTSCGRTNRRRYATVERATRCGSCHTMLPPVASPVDAVDLKSLDTILRQASVPVVIDFWAPWCGPCRVMAPELETAARRLAGQALFVKVNTDAAPELGNRFGVRSIPTLAVFHNGRERSRVTGVRSAADIQSLVVSG